MAHYFKKSAFLALLFFSFSAKAELPVFQTSQAITNKNLSNQKVEIVDYNFWRDFTAVKRIAKENWSMISSGPYSDKWIQKLFMHCESCNRFGAKTIIKVIRVNDEIAGFMTFVPGYYGLVELLAIDSKFRNQGLGYQLLSEAQKIAQKNNAKGLELYVFNHNEPAIKLYEKFGFNFEANIDNKVMLMGKPFAEPKNVFFCGTCELLKRNQIA